MKKILFIPLSYPYSIGQEESFIANELNELSNHFEEVHIYPTLIGGDISKLPNNCVVDTEYATFLQKLNKINHVNRFFYGLFSGLFFKELFNNYKLYLSLIKLIKLIIYTGELQMRIAWLNSNANNFRFDYIYTFWFTINTNAIALSKISKHTKIITRVHGADLYEHRSLSNLFYRNLVLNKINLVATISKQGQKYLQNKFIKHKNKFKTFYLGTENKISINKEIFNDDELHILSCSSVIELKRVNKIFDALNEISKHKKFKIVWNHIGGGELFTELKNRCKENNYLKINLLGNLSNEDVHLFYLNHRVDVFIHLSRTEGLPVVMMEAASYGVPILATNVGGVSEIVIDGKNGFLLPQNPNREQVVKNIEKYHKLTYNEKVSFSNFSKRHWEKHFNAKTCFSSFVETIINL